LQQKIVHPSGARNATPADQIIRAASELEADLIVIGGRERWRP
jgi:nucleotide-binding universal stress UspA family protein